MGKHVRLAELPLFTGLPEEHLRVLEESARVRTLRAGESVAAEGGRTRAFHVVLDGRVKLYRVSAEGREQTLYVFGPGEPFCLCAMFCDDRIPGHASALVESRILVLPEAALARLARQEPALLLNMLAILSGRLREALALVESLSLKEAPERLAVYLLHESRRADGDAFELPITQRELSKILGVTPESLSRTLRRMGEDGLVEVKGRAVVILDRPRLVSLAGEEEDCRAFTQRE